MRKSVMIDRVVAEAHRKGATKPPTLGYVFHPRIFWVRLELLARPEKPTDSTRAAPPPATWAAPPLAKASDPRDDDPRDDRVNGPMKRGLNYKLRGGRPP